jgi:hypothetical protein
MFRDILLETSETSVAVLDLVQTLQIECHLSYHRYQIVMVRICAIPASSLHNLVMLDSTCSGCASRYWNHHNQDTSSRSENECARSPMRVGCRQTRLPTLYHPLEAPNRVTCLRARPFALGKKNLPKTALTHQCYSMKFKRNEICEGTQRRALKMIV